MPLRAVKAISLTKRKKIGRPRLNPNGCLESLVGIRLLPRQVKKLASIASKHGKTISSWAREVLLAEAGEL